LIPVIIPEEREELSSDLAIPLTQLAGLTCGMRKLIGASGDEWLHWIDSLDVPINELGAIFEAVLDQEGSYERVLGPGRPLSMAGSPAGVERATSSFAPMPVREMIVRWRDVRAEDLAICDGVLRPVVTAHLRQRVGLGEYAHVQLAENLGEPGDWRYFHPDEYTAVQRPVKDKELADD
jgi:hypothetical protein